MQNVNINELKSYRYNSSLNLCYLPGRYNNLDFLRTIFTENNIIQFPASVTPILRIPLFWISFHNIPLFIYKLLCLITINRDKYLNIYFHPWEFFDLSLFNFPFYFKKNTEKK